MSKRTKNICVMALLCAIAYIFMFVGRFPIVLFLTYDPKDAILVMGGFMLGPGAAACIAAVVSLVEMVTVSSTGIIGLVMNIISSCSFACPAALIYKKNRSIKGALIGLLCGVGFMAVVMLLWNFLITPIYMHYPREEVAKLLLPAFLPFNLIKGGLNTALTLILYKPLISALRRTGLMPDSLSGGSGSKINVGILAFALVLLATCVLLALVLKGII